MCHLLASLNSTSNLMQMATAAEWLTMAYTTCGLLDKWFCASSVLYPQWNSLPVYGHHLPWFVFWRYKDHCSAPLYLPLATPTSTQLHLPPQPPLNERPIPFAPGHGVHQIKQPRIGFGFATSNRRTPPDSGSQSRQGKGQGFKHVQTIQGHTSKRIQIQW